MTQPSEEQVVLREFLRSAVTQLAEGQITPDQALRAALQYPFLRQALSKEINSIKAVLLNDQLLAAKLLEIFRSVKLVVEGQLVQLGEQSADRPLPPAEIAGQAKHFAAGRKITQKIINRREAQLTNLKRNFIHNLVENWIERQRDTRLAKIKNLISGEFAKPLDRLPERPAEVTGQIIATVQRFPEARDSIEVLYEISKTNETKIEELNSATDELIAFKETVGEALIKIDNPPMAADWLVSLIDRKLTQLGNVNRQRISRESAALTETLAAQHAGSRLPLDKIDLTAAGQFFQVYATGSQRLLAGFFDRTWASWSRNEREVFIAEIVRRTWEQVKNPQELTLRLGQAVIGSAFWAKAISQGNQAFGQKNSSVLSRGQTLFLDIAWTIFGGPRETILDWLEIATLGEELSAGGRGLFPVDHRAGWQEIYFLVNTTQPNQERRDRFWQFVLDAVGLVGQEAAWRVGGRVVTGVIGRGAGAATGKLAGRGLGALLGKLLGNLLARLGGLAASTAIPIPGVNVVLGALGTIFGPQILGKIWNFFGRLTSGQIGPGTGAVGPLLAQLTGKRGKKPDTGLLFALGAVIAIIILVIVAFFNGTASRDQFALGRLGGAITGEAVPLYPEEICDPKINDCRWPAHGCITQGPFTTSSHSSNGPAANAIDIGAPSGAPAVATIDGTISEGFNGCANNTGYWGNRCGNGWGNYLIIKGKDGSLRRYAHLAQNSMPLVLRPDLKPRAIAVGQAVVLGEQIGNVDHNGSSSGPHLHYQLDSPRHINSILPPPGVPSCVDEECDRAMRAENPPRSCRVGF